MKFAASRDKKIRRENENKNLGFRFALKMTFDNVVPLSRRFGDGLLRLNCLFKVGLEAVLSVGDTEIKLRKTESDKKLFTS